MVLLFIKIHYLCSPKHQEQCNKLHQPSRDATVVKLRCGQITLLTSKIYPYEKARFFLRANACRFL